MTVVRTSNVTEKKKSFPFHAINNFVFFVNRVSFFGFQGLKKGSQFSLS